MADEVYVPPAATEEEEQVQEEHEPLQIVGGQLSLAGRDLTEIVPELGPKFGAEVKTLTLSFNNLTNLKNLQDFVNLTTLEVDNNELSDVSDLPPLPQLHTLSANNNKLDDVDGLLAQFKDKFPALQYLSLLKNPACPHALLGGNEDEYRRFRLKVIFHLPTLKFLDSKPITAAEKKEAARVGQFLKVARPSDDTTTTAAAKKAAPKENEQPTPEYRPLPSDLTPMGEHSGSFGQCKYVYYGRHSEGNRFIRNEML